MVKNKLIILIKENLAKLDSNIVKDVSLGKYYDTDEIKNDIIINNIVNDYSRLGIDSKIEELDNTVPKVICNDTSLNKVDKSITDEIKPQENIISESFIQAYGGSEFATISF